MIAVVGIFALIWTTEPDRFGRRDYLEQLPEVILLVITALTLIIAIPSPARIVVGRQEEFSSNELIFYVEGDSPTGRPRDVLLQFEVWASNTGGRQAVLVSLDLVAFLDATGKPVELGFGTVRASEFRTTRQYKDTNALLVGQQSTVEHFTFREEHTGPVTLRPDDVVSRTFRRRTGILWGPEWTLERLRTRYAEVARRITQVRIKTTYRRAGKLESAKFDLAINPNQQEMYAAALKHITKDFTERPNVEPLPDWILQH